MFTFDDDEFLGPMHARQDITVLPADEPRTIKLGFTVTKRPGIGIFNPRGLSLELPKEIRIYY